MNIVSYANYGKCVEFYRGGVKVLVTVDVGPRIIYFGTENFNFMNEDIARNVNKGGEYFDENFGKGTLWYLYGGHRVWKSPEDLETYTPDPPVRSQSRWPLEEPLTAETSVYRISTLETAIVSPFASFISDLFI